MFHSPKEESTDQNIRIVLVGHHGNHTNTPDKSTKTENFSSWVSTDEICPRSLSDEVTDLECKWDEEMSVSRESERAGEERRRRRAHVKDRSSNVEFVPFKTEILFHTENFGILRQ